MTKTYIMKQFIIHMTVDDSALTSMKECGHNGLSLLLQYDNEYVRFLDDYIDFFNKNASCIKLKDEVLDFLMTFLLSHNYKNGIYYN